MSTIHMSLPESYANVTRPVNINVIEQIIAACGLADKDLKVSYMGEIETLMTVGSEIGTSNDPYNLRSKFSNSGKVGIEVREEYSELVQHTGASNYTTRPPVFRDHALGLYVEPMYHAMETTISVNYRTQNYNSARSFLDHFRTRVDRDTAILTHELVYEYPLPRTLVTILHEIHRLRELQGGYGETWKEWFYGNTTQGVDILTKMDGKGGLVSFKEKQINVQGWFEETGPPEPTKGDSGEYSIQFNYKYRYDRPAELRVSYPMIIHNQLIHKDYRPVMETTDYLRMDGVRSTLGSYFDSLIKQDFRWLEGYHGIKIPEFDTSKLPANRDGKKNLLRALVKVSPETPRTLFNLNNLGSYSLTEELLAHLIKNREHIVFNYADVFNLELIRDGSILHDHALLVSENGDVTTTFDMSIRSTYHVRLTMLEDLSKLLPVGLRTLSESPNLALCILSMLGIEDSKLPPIIADRLVPKQAIQDLYRDIRPITKHTHAYAPTMQGWVAKFIINTHEVD